VSVPGTTAVRCPVEIILLSKFRKQVSKTNAKQAATIAVDGVLCHTEEQNDGNSSKNIDVAVVQMDKREAVGWDEDYSRPWIGPSAVVNEIVVKGLKWKSAENVEDG
jgi:hypothetical protein